MPSSRDGGMHPLDKPLSAASVPELLNWYRNYSSVDVA